MGAGNLLQLRSIRGIASLDLPGFGQPELFKENALQLRLGVYLKVLIREPLNRVLEGCHFLTKLAVQLLQIPPIDENTIMLHARQNLYQGKLQSARQLPNSLIPELLLENGGHCPDC